MLLKINIFPRDLIFKFDAGTSRGILRQRKTWLLRVSSTNNPEIFGIGEAAPLQGLSVDDRQDFEEILVDCCQQFTSLASGLGEEDLLSLVQDSIPDHLPAIRFAFEMALLDLFHGGKRMIIDNEFYQGKLSIPTNGLIWMGKQEFMLKQIKEKLNLGFSCIKMKIGAIDFEQECSLLAYIRKHFSADQITIRVDANGAFHPNDALNKLEKLADYQIHSIEQPIQSKQWASMQKLCRESPIPIALDEELIGFPGLQGKLRLLEEIQPQYIILKPTLLGGIKATREWIEIAHKNQIGWWVTSALESNIGLNAISQLVSNYPLDMPQGLGTGGLFHNNITSPLTLQGEWMTYDPTKHWGDITS